MPKNSLSHEAEEKILKAARTVFIKKGYKGATTRDIAAEAGITSPLLTWACYQTPEALFQESASPKCQNFHLLLISVAFLHTHQKMNIVKPST